MAERSRADTAGLVLAGGRASRMGGHDKGLLPLAGRPLAHWALARLAPQVAACAISANRHAADYEALGVPVWADASPDFDGPLAGMLAGMRRCSQPWLAVVPCDVPRPPTDLVARLHAAAAESGALVAHAVGADGEYPVFLLARCDLAEDLALFLAAGGRAVRQWAARHRAARAAFTRPGDAGAFRGANTPDELTELERAAAAQPLDF